MISEMYEDYHVTPRIHDTIQRLLVSITLQLCALRSSIPLWPETFVIQRTQIGRSREPNEALQTQNLAVVRFLY